MSVRYHLVTAKPTKFPTTDRVVIITQTSYENIISASGINKKQDFFLSHLLTVLGFHSEDDFQ